MGVRDRELAEITPKGMLHRMAQVQIERCRLLAKTPPPEDWDGVWNLTEK